MQECSVFFKFSLNMEGKIMVHFVVECCEIQIHRAVNVDVFLYSLVASQRGV